MKKFKVDESGRIDVSEGNWGAVLDKINSFLTKSKDPPVDPGRYMRGIADQMQEQRGEVPSEIRAILEGFGASMEDEDGDAPAKEDKQTKVEDKIIQDAVKELAKNRAKRQKRDEPVRRHEEEVKGKVQKEKKHAQKWESDEFIDEIVAKLDDHRERARKRNEVKKPPPRGPKAGPEMEERDERRETPKPPSSISTSLSAASNEAFSRRMDNRSAAYHGIVHQGHPTDSPGSSPKNYDKRYFGKEHYDSIVAAAEKFLGEDWLKFGWGKNPGDVPVRAALDLAINTADSGLYQSKIDANTYNMLLNRLAGWDYDVFNETVFSPVKNRKASSMAASPAHEMLRIADDLRSTHPEMSVQIIKSVYAIMRSAGMDPEAERTNEEREIAKKLVLKSCEERGIDPPDDAEFKNLVDEVMRGLEELENKSKPAAKPEAKPEAVKVSSLDSPEVLSILIRMAHENPEYRKHCPAIFAAVKKTKKTKKTPAKKEEKEEKVPEPSVPVLKSKKDGKKGKPTKKATILAADIDW